jgi:hypothetical protein
MRRAAAGAVAFALPVAGAIGTGSAAAKTFHVTNARNDGRGSFRDAVESSNRHRGADVVSFRGGIHGDISVRKSIVVDGVLRIRGPGRRGPKLVARRRPHGNPRTDYPRLILRAGEGNVPFGRNSLVVTGISTQNLELAAHNTMTVKRSKLTGNTRAGPAVYSESNLTVVDSVVRHWDGAAIDTYRAGDIKVKHSVIAHNGTGVVFNYNGSDSELVRSRVVRNDRGVALEHYGTADIEQSVISGNAPNGGIDAEESGLELTESSVVGNKARDGGGIHSYASWIRVTNSTISGNVASGSPKKPGRGGGIYDTFGPHLDLRASTVTGNRAAVGGGVFLGLSHRRRPPRVVSSMVVGNRAPDGPDCASLTPERPISEGGNVFGTAGCGATGPGDVLTANPGLGPLADNGGPTPTRALLPGSPAIGNGVDLGLKTDQRGVRRGADPDSGSYERK